MNIFSDYLCSFSREMLFLTHLFELTIYKKDILNEYLVYFYDYFFLTKFSPLSLLLSRYFQFSPFNFYFERCYDIKEITLPNDGEIQESISIYQSVGHLLNIIPFFYSFNKNNMMDPLMFHNTYNISDIYNILISKFTNNEYISSLIKPTYNNNNNVEYVECDDIIIENGKILQIRRTIPFLGSLCFSSLTVTNIQLLIPIYESLINYCVYYNKKISDESKINLIHIYSLLKYYQKTSSSSSSSSSPVKVNNSENEMMKKSLLTYESIIEIIKLILKEENWNYLVDSPIYMNLLINEILKIYKNVIMNIPKQYNNNVIDVIYTKVCCNLLLLYKKTAICIYILIFIYSSI